jgi:hypothetical protein
MARCRNRDNAECKQHVRMPNCNECSRGRRDKDVISRGTASMQYSNICRTDNSGGSGSGKDSRSIHTAQK